MTAPRMRRDMSYRKPVPAFEPTPPPSPIPSLAGLSSPPVANHLPSLSWKGKERAPSDGTVPSLLLRVDAPAPTAQTVGRKSTHTPPPPPPPTKVDNESLRTTTSSSSGGTRKTRDSAKRSKQLALADMDFRPPTPPLPAQHRRRRLTTAFHSNDELRRPPSHAATCELDTTNSLHPGRTYGPSLRPMPSFSTEKTLWSTSMNPSSGRTTATGFYLNDSEKKMNSTTMIPIKTEHTPQNMFQVNIKKAEPSLTSQMLQGAKSFCSVFCCC
ncbi:hypothetical protein BKA70DRAFT_1258787 [Coprinopsis sp. MPI-PUGE-AT-0042]|nr:hypothetical protein BKA70DRAFT_1258787 [Coprinopsis sp. MPI-PUGE-AT-0042]